MKKLIVGILFSMMVATTILAINVSWSPNPESDIAGYRLLWGNIKGGPYTNVVDVGNVTNHIITNNTFVSGITNYMVAVAYNTSGLVSDYSNEITFVVTNKPTPVKNLKVAASSL